MQFDNRIIDDLARVASSALGVASGVRDEVEARLRQQFERLLDGLDLVTRDEFEAVRAMAAEARAENERLAERIAALEAKVGGKAAKAAAPKASKAGKAKPAKAKADKDKAAKDKAAKTDKDKPAKNA